MLADETIGRLEAVVPALNKRTKGALDLTEMLRRKALPNYSPAAFVVLNGISGGTAQFSESMFVQAAEEVVSVILVLRTAGDVTGAKGQAELHTLVWAVIYALCGWAPADADPEGNATDPIGVLVLRRGRVNSLDAGTVFYQLDFAIQQQVRVVS